MFEEKKFNLPSMNGLSEKQISEHLKLYAGYVKNSNMLFDKIAVMEKEAGSDAYVLAALRRRVGFEYNGMRLHELYFESLGGDGVLGSLKLRSALEKQFGSFDAWLALFKQAAMGRGTGWLVLYQDGETGKFINAWVGDHEIGMLAGAKIILPLDLWEHAFLLDYLPGERAKYIDAFFANLNWEKVGARLG